jgi:hypothetical protein
MAGSDPQRIEVSKRGQPAPRQPQGASHTAHLPSSTPQEIGMRNIRNAVIMRGLASAGTVAAIVAVVSAGKNR